MSSSDSNHKDGWPENVHEINFDELGLLGIHKHTQKLHWDGKEVVTKTVIKLRYVELALAVFVTVGTFGMFILALGDTFGWWTG
jgi:hypothetical protein